MLLIPNLPNFTRLRANFKRLFQTRNIHVSLNETGSREVRGGVLIVCIWWRDLMQSHDRNHGSVTWPAHGASMRYDSPARKKNCRTADSFYRRHRYVLITARNSLSRT